MAKKVVKAKQREFPAQLAVKFDGEPDNQYFVAEDAVCIDSLVESTPTRIATYELVDVRNFKLVTEVVEE